MRSSLICLAIGTVLSRLSKQIQARWEGVLSSVLEANYALVVDHNALRKYCHQHNLWSIKADAPTPSRVLAGKRKIGEAMGRSQDDCWNYTTEIESILKGAPDAGGWAIASKLKSMYSIIIDYNTLGRWLKQHRDALLDGTLERPMKDEDGRPDAYATEIAAILQAEPNAGFDRVHTELRRLYQVAVPHKRLRTYLDTLDRSTIGGGGAMSSDSIARRRSPKDTLEHGSEWLSLNEARVYELLTTLGVCGWDKLQQTILEHCGTTIAEQPLRTFLDLSLIHI